MTQAMLQEWGAAHPGVNPETEVRKMALWLQGNPERKKTARGMTRFALGWLGRAQNEGRGKGGTSRASPPPCPNSRAHEADAAFLSQLDQFEEAANA